MDIYLFMGIIFVLYTAQVILSNFQIKHFREKLQLLKLKGKVGFAQRKGILRGSAILLLSDEDGIIKETHLLSGTTVFSRFKKSELFLGRHLDEVDEIVRNDKREKYILKATDEIREQFILELDI